MSVDISRINNELNSTLQLLQENGLVLFFQNSILDNNRSELTWPNHQPGRENCGDYFSQIEQYKYIISNGAYTCLLYDYSAIRVAYKIESGRLVSHNLLWWPSPFPNTKLYTDEGGILDFIDYLSAAEWNNEIRMRTPMRFDYDSSIHTEEHPSSHIHFQSSDCRLALDFPICFNKFITFIFRHFYPEKYREFEFWDDLDYLNISPHKNPSVFPGHPFLAWDHTSRESAMPM